MQLIRLVTSSLLLVTLISACAFSEKKNRDEAQLHSRIGGAMLEQGRYPQALRELLTAEELDPQNAAIQNNLGLAYFLREHPELGVRHLEKALTIDPKYTEARNNYGRILIELGRYDEAAAQLKKVLTDLTYSDPAKAWINLGLAHFRQGDFRSAQSDLSEALRLTRDNCLAQTLYGRSLFELADYSAAARALDIAITICESNKYDEPYYFSGLAYYKMGRQSHAINRMREVIKLNPSGAYAKKAESLIKLMK